MSGFKIVCAPCVRIGEIRLFMEDAASIIEDGVTWLQFNGQTYSPTTYPTLYARIGTTTLADPRGRALGIAGAGTGLTSRALFESVGVESHKLTSAESGLPSHAHGVNPTPVIETNGNEWGFNAGNATRKRLTETYSNTAADAAQAHNNMQPTMFLGYAYVCAKIEA